MCDTQTYTKNYLNNIPNHRGNNVSNRWCFNAQNGMMNVKFLLSWLKHFYWTSMVVEYREQYSYSYRAGSKNLAWIFFNGILFVVWFRCYFLDLSNIRLLVLNYGTNVKDYSLRHSFNNDYVLLKQSSKIHWPRHAYAN